MRPPDTSDTRDLLDVATRAAFKAGNELRFFRNRHGLKIQGEIKSDGSIVTEADRRASDAIRKTIHESSQNAFILDEEASALHTVERPDRFWIVDPLDGTWYFANGHDCFCVLIAHVTDGIPDVGVIYFPTTNEMLSCARGYGAFGSRGTRRWNLELTHPTRVDELVMLGSDNPKARHIYEHLAKSLRVRSESAGKSTDNKYCHLLEGNVDLVATRMGSPAIWDIAAGHCLVSELGGVVTTLYGEPIDYTTTLKFNRGTLAIGNASLIPEIVSRLPPHHRHYTSKNRPTRGRFSI